MTNSPSNEKKLPIFCHDCFILENKWVIATKFDDKGLSETWAWLCLKHFQIREMRWIIWGYEKKEKWKKLGLI